VSDVTRILSQIESGDPAAAEQLLPIVYDELRRLAAAKLAREKPGQTLNATALVHEAYLRLVGDQGFADRRHFFRVAAEAMRQILIDRARRKQRVRHGGGRQRVPLSEVEAAEESSSEQLLAIDEALEGFATHEPAKAELVKLRYYAGLTEEEAAAALGISRATASRYWNYARAWLINAVDEKIG
jgi:RNA polymerase sigma factor (TIGR02999 family)